MILGATGRLGSAAVDAFARAGWLVLAHSRRSPPATPQVGVRWVCFDLHDVERARTLCAGACAVVHAINPPYADWKHQLLTLAHRGMDIAQALGALFMLPGNVYNFGSHMPPRLTEKTAEFADTPKGRLRVELEKALLVRSGQGLRSVVIRSGDFFGHGRGSWFDLALARSLKQRWVVYPGPLDRVHAWAYLPDLARAFVAVAERPVSAGFERIHFSGYALTGTQMVHAVATAASRLGLAHGPVRTRRIPWGLLRVGAVFIPPLRDTVEMAYLWEVSHALDGHALERRVGKLPKTPVHTAVENSLRQLYPD